MNYEVLYLIILLGAGLFIWLRPNLKFQRTWVGVEPLKLSWLDGGFSLWLIFISVLAVQFLTSELLATEYYKKTFGENLLWRASFFALSIQLPILLSILILAFTKKEYMDFLRFQFSAKSVNPLFSGIYSFFRYMPLILGVTLLYRGILQLLSKLGYLEMPPLQPMVELYKESSFTTPFFILAFCTVIIAPFVEEIFFRGILFRFLKNHWSYSNALMTSSVIFALIHMNLASFIPLCFLGYLLGQSFEKSGTLWSAIVFHALFNFQTLLMIMIL